MATYEIRQGTRLVVIEVVRGYIVRARLYLNNGETASLQSWRGTTTQGAERWAKKVLARN